MAAGLSDGSGNRLAVLSPLSPDQQIVSKAPDDNVGSFLVDTAPRSYPIDELTGLPPVVLTYKTAQPVAPSSRVTDHHIHYQRTNDDLEGQIRLSDTEVLRQLDNMCLSKLGGLAVRVSRTQQLEHPLHRAVHSRFLLGLERQAHTIDEKFVTALQNCAGVVPKWAIDVTAPLGEELVYMSNATFNEVTKPVRIGVEDYVFGRPRGYQSDVLGSFFLRYAAFNNLTVISKCLIKQFLSLRDGERKLSLGSRILQEAVDATVAPHASTHQALRELGMVRSRIPDLRSVVWYRVSPEVVLPLLPRMDQQLKKVA